MQTQLHEPKRVALIFPLHELGGMQSSVCALAKGLNRRGIIPDVLWDVEPNWSYLQSAGANVRYRTINFRISTPIVNTLPYSLRILARLFNTINGEKFVKEYDFFYSFYNGFIVPEGVPHLYHIALPPLPIVSEGSRRKILLRLFRWFYKKSIFHLSPIYEIHEGRNYCTNAQYTAAILHKEEGLDVPVVYPPIDFSGREFDHEDLGQRDSLVFFSRIVDYKRPKLVLELAKRHKHLRCVTMGAVVSYRQEYFTSLQKRAQQIGLQNVVFIANPSRERILEELARARYYFCPTINEHFGMTTAEAIASGAIPFVHDSGGQREIVNEGRLRFTDSELFSKFDSIVKMTEQELSLIRKRLFMHVKGYSEEVFISKMLSYLDHDGR